MVSILFTVMWIIKCYRHITYHINVFDKRFLEVINYIFFN